VVRLGGSGGAPSRWRLRIVAAGVLFALMAVSIALRVPSFEKPTATPNIEASYHVLLTASALSESPISEHWLLPTVSLGRANDKDVHWGATIRTPSGHYVYTSFAPPGFLAPFLFLEAFSLEKTIFHLAIFNMILQVLSCILLYRLLTMLLYKEGFTPAVATGCALAGVSLQILSTEALLSFGLVYWSQQLFQVIMIAALIFLAKVIESEGRNCSRWIILLLFLCYFGAWTEWTGFVFNLGIAALLFIRGDKTPTFRYVCAGVVVVTMAALATIVLHYALVAGLEPTLRAIAGRFLARSAGNAHPYSLLSGYLDSYGWLILVVAFAAAYPFVADRSSRPRWIDLRTTIGCVFLVSAFALGENLIMLQHATQFTFDRLKAVVPAAILLSYGCAKMMPTLRIGFAAFLAAALWQNALAYGQVVSSGAAWENIHRANAALAREIGEAVNLQCAVLGTKMTVRGYSNLMFGRAIHENIDLSRLQEIVTTSAANCGGVYLMGKAWRVDMPRYQGAVILDKDGNVRMRLSNQK